MLQNNVISYYRRLAGLGGWPGWLMLFFPVLMMLISRRRDTAGVYATVDGSAFIMILFAGAAFLVSLYYLFIRKNSGVGQRLLSSFPVVLFLLYHIWCFCTGFWSVDFKLTFFRSFECLSFMMLVVASLQELRKRASLEEILQWSLLLVTVNIVTGFLKAVKMGVAPSPTLAQFEATTFFFMALLYAKSRIQKILIVVLACLSMSTAGYAGMGVGGLFVVARNKKHYGLYSLLAFCFVFLFLFVDYKEVLRVTVFRNHPEIVEKWDFASHSSGRDTIHRIAFKAFNEKPLAGWGFVACEPYISHKVSWGAGLVSFHSGYLSALVGTGLIGFSIFALFLVSIIALAFSSRIPPSYRAFCQATIVVVIAHTLSNPGMGARVYGTWLPCYYMAALISLIAKFPRPPKTSSISGPINYTQQ